MIEIEPEDDGAGGARLPALDTDSPAATRDVARRFAGRLSPGDVILLFGEMGAGKTCFVQGLAEGLGLDPRRVHSPTFIMVNRYPGPVALNHVDLYRLQEGEDFSDLALDDLFASRDVTVVEWAERLPPVARPCPRWEIRLRHAGGDRRHLDIRRAAAAPG